jgi:hypothetical protein
MSVAIFGQHDFGKIEEVDGTYIATTFHHGNFLPRSVVQSWVVLDAQRRIPIERHERSIRLAVLRTWPWVIGPLVAIFGGLFLRSPVVFAVVLGLSVAIGVTALFSGRLGDNEKARRRAYARVLGAPIDPAFMVIVHPELAETMRARLESLRETLPIDAYRGNQDSFDWKALARDPKVVDRGFLETAMVLARLETSSLFLDESNAAAALSDEIWARLSRTDLATTPRTA